MNSIALYYAQCNRLVNEQMHAVLAKAFDEPYTVALEGYYFHTLGQILDHLFVADMLWMKSFTNLAPGAPDLEAEVRALPSYGETVFTRFADFLPYREKLDDWMCRFVAGLDDAFFDQVVSRRAKDGTLMERSASRALVHCFNHQTHHRGQISQILDRLNIENNYSNMIFLDP